VDRLSASLAGAFILGLQALAANRTPPSSVIT